MSAKTLFLLLAAPLLPWTAFDLWIHLNIRDWAENRRSFSLMTRSLIALDTVFVRYAVVVRTAAFLLGPLMAAVLFRAALPEAMDSRPHERATSKVSALGEWLAFTAVLTTLAVLFPVLGPEGGFGSV